jgi:two-component system, NarL family, sensor histidine kinase UhpB
LLRTRLDRLTSIVDQSVVDLQRIAADLRPMILDELGLVSAMQWLTQNLTEGSALSIELSFDREDVAYASDVSTAVFRIVQEALTNIVRHSRATHARVAVLHAADELMLEVSDNGRGMHLADTKRERLGLVGMGERAHMLGGSMNIESTPGHGTRISARLPLISDKSAKAAAR